MKEIEINEEIFTARLSHACRFSLDCKMFGAYCYLSEIRGAIPLLHGPLGCAFFPKLVPPDAIRRQLLGLKEAPPFPCTHMDERDVVYGGAEKLAEAIIAVDRYYRPELIGVIVSCPAAIIGDDITDIVKRVRNRIDADVIYTPSSAGFGDDERTDDFNRHAEDLIKIWKNPDEKPTWGIEKCGRLDTLYSLIEQLVERPRQKLKKAINIDTYGRFHYHEDLAGELNEMKAILEKIGITVNTVFPGCSVQDIKKMAQAELNFMRRSERSAKFLEEKFGMEYVFDIFGTRYIGIEGAKRFYLDMARRFGLEARGKAVIREREKDLETALSEIRREIKGKNIAYVCTPLHTSPEIMRLLEMFGLNIRVLSINTEWWKRWGMSRSTVNRVVREFKASLTHIRSDMEICWDLTIEEELERLKESNIDLVMGDVLISDTSRTMFYENHGIRALNPHAMGYSSFRISFSQNLRLGRMIADRLRSPVWKKDLIYLQYPYHPGRYPTLSSEISDEFRWEKIMKKVWRGGDHAHN